MEYIVIGIIIAFVAYSFLGKDKKTTPTTAPKKTTPVEKKHNVSELKKLTKVQLLELADKNNIKVKRSGSKAEVVKIISEHK